MGDQTKDPHGSLRDSQARELVRHYEVSAQEYWVAGSSLNSHCIHSFIHSLIK